MITADEGISAYHSASSLVMTRGVTCNPGRSLGRDPVARTTSVAVIVRSATRTPGPAWRTAEPRITSIFRAFTRPVSPETSLSTILVSNAWTCVQSGSPEALMPHSSERLTVSMTAADCRSALVGMQPRSRQVPPSRSSRSTIATRLPICAARRAQE